MYWQSVLICILILIVTGCIFCIRISHQHMKENLKYMKPIPFFGNMWPLLFRKNLMYIYADIYNAFPTEKYFGFFDFLYPVICIRDTEVLKQVAVKDFECFLDHRCVLHEELDGLGANTLFILKGQKWKEMRSLMTPAFTSTKIKNMLPFVKECCSRMGDFLNQELDKCTPDKNGEILLQIESKDVYTRYASDVIASIAFGVKVDSFKDRDNIFYKHGIAFSNINVKFFIKYVIYLMVPSLMKLLNIHALDQKATAYFKNLILDNMKEREEKGIKRLDMIHILLQLKKGCLSGEETQPQAEDKNDLKHEQPVMKNWTDDELIAQALIFFVAGFESNSSFFCFASYELAMHQDLQEKLREEIDSVGSIEDLSYDDIMSMKYVDKFVSECLRLYPSISDIDRVCTKPCTLLPPNDKTTQGIKLNVGDTVNIPIRSIQRDPRYYSDPEKFDPERFSEENRASIQPYTFLPFGSGPRQCIGRRFSMMQLKITLIYLVRNFHFVPCSRTKDPATQPRRFLSTVPTEGIWIGFKRRPLRV